MQRMSGSSLSANRGLTQLPSDSVMTRPTMPVQGRIDDQLNHHSPPKDSGDDQAQGAAPLQDRYAARIVGASSALIAYVDTQERYRFVNPAYCAWLGKIPDQIMGHTVAETIGSLYVTMQPHIAAALRGEPTSFEAAFDHPEQGQRALAVVHAPNIDSNGAVCGFCAVALDITSHKQRRALRPTRERRVCPAADNVPIFIAQCDEDYRLRFVNKAYVDRFGFNPDELIGQRIPDLIGDEAFSSFRQYLDAALAGKMQEHEMRLPSRDAGEHYVHMMYVPECDDKGRVRGLIATFSDTTCLRRAEDQLHRRELEFKTLVENSPDVISRIDSAMRHLYVNPAIESAFGKPANAYLGKTKAELGFPVQTVRQWDDAARIAFATSAEQTCDSELEIDGMMRYFSTRFIPEPDRDGNIDSLLCVTYDITERTLMEKERDELLARERAARIQAETAARARDEFLAIVSHELRAPLNGIQSWAHVLENYVNDVASIPLAQRALKGIKTGVGQQVRLIEDLLDVTRMMSGKMRLAKQPLALLPVVQAAVATVRSMATAKRIALSCTYHITNEQIEGDSDRVQQIIWNLLSNAIKFTVEGGNVWLTVARNDHEACITIRDDGIGISPDFLPQLFDRFSQEDTSSTRDHSGLGLGLFLVRHLVELHNGRVTAHSEGEGQGTTFLIHLPLRISGKYVPATRSDESPHAPISLPSLNGMRILLIDDQEEARESLSVVLTSAGANVFAAPSAKVVLDWLSTLSVENMPDVLVCDIAMPGEDGYAVLRKLRAWKTPNGFAPLQRLPALALTAFSQREDRIRALTAGFQMHMSKPVVPEELIIVIATIVPRD